MKLNQLKGKKILILGLGREGKASFLFLRKLFPKKIIGLADKAELKELNLIFQKLIKRDPRVELHLGENYLEAIGNYDIVLKSPGIPPKPLKSYLKNSGKIISQTEIFFENCPGKIIGITGTKGKSTVSTVIYRVLREGGISDIHLIGNIGKPAISFLEKAAQESIFVYELSSHQLAGLKKSPHIAVLLSIFPEHMDYYEDFKEYAAAKANITLFQKKNDILIFNAGSKVVQEIAEKSKAGKFIFGPRQGKYPGCFLRKEAIYYSRGKFEEKILNISDIGLKGLFNTINLMPAVIIGKMFNIPAVKIAKTIKNFRGLPHRLEYVGKYGEIEFYNDSLATIPEATMEAFDALGKNVETIILGGFDRGIGFKNLAAAILKSNIKTLIFFPTSGQRIWKEILKQGARKKFRRTFREIKTFFTDSMQEAVGIAYKYTAKGGICLLSCASPSFGIFKDYKERGNLFKKYVKSLERKQICYNYR